TTTDETGKTLLYDAWNRLVQVKSGATVLDAYAYDTLGRRVSENPGTQRDLYYSDARQGLEGRGGGQGGDQHGWRPVYVDALVERDRDADGNPANGLEERLYAQQDANYDVTTLVSTTGSGVERDAYDPYGSVTVLAPNWSARGASNYGWVYL